jgi:hypothetical protein
MVFEQAGHNGRQQQRSFEADIRGPARTEVRLHTYNMHTSSDIS